MVTRVIMADDDFESLSFVYFLLFVSITGNFFTSFAFLFCVFNLCFVLRVFGDYTVFSLFEYELWFLFL